MGSCFSEDQQIECYGERKIDIIRSKGKTLNVSKERKEQLAKIRRDRQAERIFKLTGKRYDPQELAKANKEEQYDPNASYGKPFDIPNEHRHTYRSAGCYVGGGGGTYLSSMYQAMIITSLV